MTPLHYVAENGHFEVARALLEKGAVIEATDAVRTARLTQLPVSISDQQVRCSHARASDRLG